MRTENLQGKRFGKLVVLQIDPEFVPKSGRHTRWLCQCDCGATKSVQSNHLKDGSATACCAACKNRIENGTRFGKLVVLEQTSKRDKNGGGVIYKCRCDCGEIIEVVSTELRAGRKSCCKNCNTSLGAERIKTLLLENNIEFIQEYCFQDCVNPNTNRKLRFDFYIIDKNYLIEFDGEQHFKAIDYFGGNEEFQKIKIRDEIKNNYCKKNNIPLIRIPYTHQNDIKIEDLLLSTSNFIIDIL